MPTMRAAEVKMKEDPFNKANQHALYTTQYHYSKYYRRDNTSENAKYLGYLDAKELYPEFTPRSFQAFARELVNGQARRPYDTLLLPC